MSINKGHPDDIDIHWTLNRVSKKILSGAFDADDSEIQRLRAALHKITQIYDDPNLHDLTACHEMNRVAKEALSTTIEPTNTAKVERFECPCCGCEINAREKVGTEWPKAEGDGNDAN